MIDQDSVARYLGLKGWTAVKIHNDIKETLGASCKSYQSITRAIRLGTIGTNCDESHELANFIEPSNTDEKILEVLDEFPFSSVRQIAHKTNIPRSTVYDHLIKIGVVCRHFHWVPHSLTPEQKKVRVRLCYKLLKVIRTAKKIPGGILLQGMNHGFI